MMFLLIIIFIQCICSLKSNNYLSKPQWAKINSLIKKTDIPLVVRDKINNILYTYYEKWALKKAKEFKRFHKHKCINIKLDELELYSKFGLHKATLNYNGNSSFVNYADKYILGELYNGLTKLHTLTILPESYRKKNIENKKNVKNIPMNVMDTQFVSFDNYWIFDNHYKHIENQHLNNIIVNDEQTVLVNYIHSKLDTFSKRVFYYKYDMNFKPIRSNKVIAELMCCSEEKVRVVLKDIHGLLNPLEISKTM